MLKLAAETANKTEVTPSPKPDTSQQTTQSQPSVPEGSRSGLSNFDFGELPAAPAVPNYRETYARPYPATRRKQTRQVNWKPLLIAMGCLFGVGGLGIAGLAMYLWIPASVMRNLNPLGDSHASVLRRLNAIASSMVSELDSIQDDLGRQRAIKRFEALCNEAHELRCRASYLGEVDDQELNRLVSQFTSDAGATKERLQTALANLRQRNLMSSELATSGIDMTFAMDDVVRAIQIGWKKLPAPASKSEELVRLKVAIQRDIWREVASVSNKNQYDKLAGRLTSFPRRYQKLHDLQQEVLNQGPFGENFVTKYSSVSFDISFQLADLKIKQTALYGSNPELSAQLEAIKQAEAELTRNQMAGPLQPYGGNAMFGGPPQNGMPSGLAPFPRSAQPQTLNQFTQHHGIENTVTLRINSTVILPARAKEIVDKVTEIQVSDLGQPPTDFLSSREGNTTIIVFKYKGSLDRVASRIDFGKVASVDSRKREIVVDCAD